jgi:hypothetical protein
MAREMYRHANRDLVFARHITFLLASAERKGALGDEHAADILRSMAAHNMVDRHLSTTRLQERGAACTH